GELLDRCRIGPVRHTAPVGIAATARHQRDRGCQGRWGDSHQPLSLEESHRGRRRPRHRAASGLTVTNGLTLVAPLSGPPFHAQGRCASLRDALRAPWTAALPAPLGSAMRISPQSSVPAITYQATLTILKVS